MDFLNGLPSDKRKCMDSMGAGKNPNSNNFSSSTNKQFNMYTQLMNGHRKAITKHRIEQKMIQSKNAANNFSQNALTSRCSEKGTIKRINGRETRLLKTTTTTNSKNLNSITGATQLSKISQKLFKPEATSQEKIISISNHIHHSLNSLLILRNGYLWRTAAMNQVIGKTKKRKKPGGARNSVFNNGGRSMFKFRETFGLMVCCLGQTVTAWNDHYGEEDGK